MKKLSEDHKEIESGKKLDDEGYMAKVEMQKIAQSLDKLKKVIKSSDKQIPAWVQSKITKASDYLDIAADYLASDVEMDENTSFTINPKSHTQTQKREKTTQKIQQKATNNPSPAEAKVAKTMLSKRGPQLPEETSLVDKILSEIEEEKKYMTKKEDPCWKGYEMIGKKKKNGKEVPNCVPVKEQVDSSNQISSSEKQARLRALRDKEKSIKSEIQGTMRGLPSDALNEATTRLPMQTGQLLKVLINWRGKHLSVQMFFPQLGTPRRDEITYAVNKVYPEARVISYVPCEMDSSTPIVQVREDWQKLNKKDNVDGMGEKSIKEYRKENPGSELKPAVTEENPTGERKKRQDQYCSRAGGQKEMHNIDCSKTPDKPICKSMRRWNC